MKYVNAFRAVFMLVPPHSPSRMPVSHLQVSTWFVTTVKHGTALEALARRESRRAVLKFVNSTACEREPAEHLASD
jgi:hypothetical protein